MADAPSPDVTLAAFQFHPTAAILRQFTFEGLELGYGGVGLLQRGEELGVRHTQTLQRVDEDVRLRFADVIKGTHLHLGVVTVNPGSWGREVVYI